MKLYVILFALVVAGVSSQAQSGQSPSELRNKAGAFAKDGNWKDALEVSRVVLDTVDDRESGKDLIDSLRYLRELRKVSDADELIESAVSRHSSNWRLLRQAAKSYQQLQH